LLKPPPPAWQHQLFLPNFHRTQQSRHRLPSRHLKQQQQQQLTPSLTFKNALTKRREI
jgi:hypothetical protein